MITTDPLDMGGSTEVHAHTQVIEFASSECTGTEIQYDFGKP
jgi:hypothetical protein